MRESSPLNQKTPLQFAEKTKVRAEKPRFALKN
jgi:hypothetical protein